MRARIRPPAPVSTPATWFGSDSIPSDRDRLLWAAARGALSEQDLRLVELAIHGLGAPVLIA
jgi:hypothetical protein